MKICIVYDCLYPLTVGGAERWYRNLAERLAAGGHSVTYITRRQWEPGDEPVIPGVTVVAVSRDEELYGPDGTRRIGQSIRFGAGVLSYLLRRGGDFDVVHTACAPYFSLLAAASARIFHRYRLVVDWFEVWTRDYWREYAGAFTGEVGNLIQLVCIKVPQSALCLSRLHIARLVAAGVREQPTLLEGAYEGPPEPPMAPVHRDRVVFAGRQIPEKNAVNALHAVAAARERGIDVDAVFFGDGPEHERLRQETGRLGLQAVVRLAGFAPTGEVEDEMAHGLCLLHPSSREGYGLVVLEAASRGTPVIVVDGPDNAATELVENGINGFVSPSAGPDDLADCIESVYAAGPAIRASTRAWFEENRSRLSLESSVERILEVYSRPSALR